MLANQPALGPIVGKVRCGREPDELASGGDTASARSGTGWVAAPESAEPVVDPLELSLARPGGTTPRELTRAPPATDAAVLVALERVVERLSFGGDRRSGIARIELGGAWAGTVLVLRASGRDVELELAGGSDARALGERLVARLRSRGFDAEVAFS